MLFRPKKQFARVEEWVPDPNPRVERLEAAGLLVLETSKRGKSIRFRLAKPEAEQHCPLLKDFFEACYAASKE